MSLVFLALLACGLRSGGIEARVGLPAPLEVSLALETRAALRRGIEWLCRRATTDVSRADDARAAALTALALGLAPTPETPAVRDALERARQTLVRQRYASGDFGDKSTTTIETAALVCLALTVQKQTPAGNRTAHEAARFLLRVQNDGGGFPRTAGDAPEAVPTAWAAWALRARLRRAPDDEAPEVGTALRTALDRAIAWVERSMNNARDTSPRRDAAAAAANLFALTCLPERLNAARLENALGSVVEPQESTTVSAYAEWACLTCLALRPRPWSGLRLLSAPRRDAVHRLRERTVRRLLSLQQGDGSWGDTAAGARRTAGANDRVTATARAVLALENALDAAEPGR